MAVPASDWKQGAVFTFGAATAVAAATSFKAAVDAHPNIEVTADSLGGGGPSYYIEFKHVNGALTDMRYIVGFGALPAKRISATPGSDSNYIWVGFSPDADTTGPDAAWTDATPYTSARFAGFHAVKGYSGAESVDNVYIHATDEQVFICLEDTGVSPPSVHCVQMGANMLPSCESYAEDNGRMYAYSATTYYNQGISSYGPFNNISGVGNLLVGPGNSDPYAPAYVYLKNSSSIEYMSGYLTTSFTPTVDAFTTADNEFILVDFPMYGQTRAKVVGFWRQMYPVRGLRRQVMQDATPEDTGYIVAVSDAVVYPGVFLANS